MKFRNESGKDKPFKINGKFYTVQNNAVFEHNQHITEEGIVKVSDKEIVNLDEIKYIYKVAEKVERSTKESKAKAISKPKLIILDKKELSELTKDELNDYAAKRNLGDIKPRWLKSKMVREVLKLQNAKK